MKQPKFSIIIPVYKAEKTIHKCLDSILAQTVTDFELILVNDGSPDNSGAICDEYAAKDNRIKVLHKKNGGASAARNIGLNKAIGENVCFVDSDDYVAPDFLDIFGECRADITIQGMYVKKPEDAQEQYWQIIEDTYDAEKIGLMMDNLYKSRNTGFLVTRAFKRKIIEANELRLNERYRLREDEEFVWRYMCKCKTFATVNKGAYHYEMPDFSLKYIHIDSDSDFNCTKSIIQHIVFLTDKYNHPCIVNNINRLAYIIQNSYRKKDFDYSRTNKYLIEFQQFYKKVKGNRNLNKKSKIIYYMIGTHTPKFLHKIYNKILSRR